MKTTEIKNPIEIVCVEAESFPEGVQAAHEKLHRITDNLPQRRYFGISWPDGKGGLVYKAAAEELYPGELRQFHLSSFTIRAGKYLYFDIHNYMQHIPDIGIAFQKLIHSEKMDSGATCIEWYIDQTTCRCMVLAKN